MTRAAEIPLKSVSRFEANLLEILRFLLQGEPLSPSAAEAAAEQALQGPAKGPAAVLIFGRCPRPACLSRAAVELVQDRLRKGCPLLLARSSGWWRARHLRAERVVEGRLWERSAPVDLHLSFSGHSLEFLIWITAENPIDKKATWPRPPSDELTVGDLLLFYRVFAMLRQTTVGAVVRSQPLFASNPLCRLACADSFDGDILTEVDFLPWTNGVGACILEALQHTLARHWLEAERAKGEIAEWQRMQEIGQSQTLVLDRFLSALKEARRLDLARFVLTVLANVLAVAPNSAWWTAGLSNLGPRLADRAATNLAALALVRQTERLSRWTHEARGVTFFEENYAATQLWQADWERWRGEALHARAQELLREVEPMQERESRS